MSKFQVILVSFLWKTPAGLIVNICLLALFNHLLASYDILHCNKVDGVCPLYTGFVLLFWEFLIWVVFASTCCVINEYILRPTYYIVKGEIEIYNKNQREMMQLPEEPTVKTN